MALRTTIESQLEKLSPRDKKLLTGMVLFLGVGALVMLTMTLVGFQRALEEDVRNAKMALMEVQTQQAAYDVAEAKLKAQEARIEQFSGTALSAHVESLAEQLGIKDGLRDAQRSEMIEENGVQTTKWKVVLKGRTYDEAVNFLLRLENSGYPLRVENARMKGTTVKREPAVDLTLDLYTFKVLEDQG
jgi:type II secretory pathway component PulM